MPAKVNKKRPTAPDEPMNPWAKWAGYLFFTVLLVAGGALYLKLGRDSQLAGTLPLPKRLQTVSAAHDDLMLFGRALNELATEAGNRLPDPPGTTRPATPRFEARASHLHSMGRQLEPLVTRQESRVLIAFQNGERLIDDFIGGRGDVPYDQGMLIEAKRHLAIGFELGRGKDINQLLLGKNARRPDDQTPRKKSRLTGDFSLLAFPSNE